jgi:hypothetical protein
MAVIDGAIALFKKKFEDEKALLAYVTSTWEHKRGPQLLTVARVESHKTCCIAVTSSTRMQCALCQETSKSFLLKNDKICLVTSL